MPSLTPTLPSGPDRRHFAALLLSILLHLLVALILRMDWHGNLPIRPEDKAMEVEVVTEAPKPPPPAPLPPPQPEIPKPEPEAKPTPPLPLQHPQLQPAPLAEKSAAPHPAQRPDHVRPSAEKGPGLSANMATNGQKVQTVGRLSQSAQDLVLAQVVAMWHFDTVSLRGTNWVLTATLEINHDGTLAGPMNKDAPWRPDQLISGYSAMPDGVAKRMMETFLLALRLAQPLKLPPDDGKPWPRGMVLRFKPGDLSAH